MSDFGFIPDQQQPQAPNDFGFVPDATATVGPLEDVQGTQAPPAMTPDEMSRTGQTQFEPSTVTAGTEPTKISEALRANIQPMLEHPVDSFTGMFTNWDDVRHLLQQPQDIAGPTLKHALGMPVAPQEEIGSQQFYNTGIGAALAAGAMRGGEKPPSVTDQIRESMTPDKPTEAPVNAPEAPVARPDTEAVSPQPGAATGTPVTAKVTVPTMDDLRQALSEGRMDDARDIALQMERATKQPKPAVDVPPGTPTVSDAGARPVAEGGAGSDASPERGSEPNTQNQAPTASPSVAEPSLNTSDELQASQAQAGQRDTASRDESATATVGRASPEASIGRGQDFAAGTSNRQNVETYGKDEVPSGTGVDTGELLDNARTAIRNRSVNPYSVLSKTRDRGIANPEEYAALAAEHERLVNNAVAKEKVGDLTAPEAAQQAKDFANAIQPHKTAASDLFRLFQGDLNYDLGTQFGMDQYMHSELGHGMKPKDVPRFRQMSNDIRGAEGEVPQAVTRSDARVQGRYRNVADIPIQDAAARVREMLKDCA